MVFTDLLKAIRYGFPWLRQAFAYGSYFGEGLQSLAKQVGGETHICMAWSMPSMGQRL